MSQALVCPTCHRAMPPVKKGEAHPNAELLEEDVLEIRRLYAEDGMKYEFIADLYAVSKSCVAHIIQRRTWKHI